MRAIRVFGPAVLLACGVVAAILALIWGGGAAPLALEDPGPVVRYGLPLVTMVFNLGVAGLIGSLLLGLWVLSPNKREYTLSLDVAAASAALMTVSAATTAIFTFVSVSGKPLSFDSNFGAQLGQFLTQISLGQAWLSTTLIAAVVTVLAFLVRNHTGVFFVAALAAISLYPIAQQGHAAGTTGHFDAVSALGLHLLFAGIWLGGLLSIVLLNRRFDRARLVTVMGRYSTLALICFIVVATSGYVSAALRIGTWGQLETAYGGLVVVKVAALLAMGVIGAWQRRRMIRRLSDGVLGAQRRFWSIVLLELAFMGIASGVAVALARTAPPVSQNVDLSQLTPAEILSGSPLPPWPDLYRYFSEWHLDIIWVLVIGFGTFFYLAGVWRLRQRGDRWPIYRTILWLLGMATLFYLTNGGVAVYEQFLFSAHMFGHMGLTMLVPILLVPGAPITLALRTIRPRTDGSRGSREWIMIAVHSWFGRLVTNPIVAAVVFAGSLWVFYFTPILNWAMSDHLGHEFMTVHFLISGYLFVQSLIGIDPVPFRFSYPMRLLVLMGTMTVHAFFGVTVMSSTGLLAASWFGSMGWGMDALVDQQTGGGIAWGVGEFPILALALIISVQWSRADKRETRRLDRNADRTNNAELNDYNRHLQELADRDLR